MIPITEPYPFYAQFETALGTFKIPAKWVDKIEYVAAFSEHVRKDFLKKHFYPSILQNHQDEIIEACFCTADFWQVPGLGFFVSFQIFWEESKRYEVTSIINPGQSLLHYQQMLKREMP